MVHFSWRFLHKRSLLLIIEIYNLFFNKLEHIVKVIVTKFQTRNQLSNIIHVSKLKIISERLVFARIFYKLKFFPNYFERRKAGNFDFFYRAETSRSKTIFALILRYFWHYKFIGFENCGIVGWKRDET